MEPVPLDDEVDVPEGLRKYVICANCLRVKEQHSPDGKCLFEASTFLGKRMTSEGNGKFFYVRTPYED